MEAAQALYRPAGVTVLEPPSGNVTPIENEQPCTFMELERRATEVLRRKKLRSSAPSSYGPPAAVIKNVSTVAPVRVTNRTVSPSEDAVMCTAP